MNQASNALSNYLILYHFADTELDPSFALYIQAYPGYDYRTNFKFLQEKHLQKIKEFSFLQLEKESLLSLTVEDGDIIFIRAINNEIVTAGGIWQVQWRNDEDYGGANGYVFAEVSSSGIEMMKVETLLQEEEYTLFEDVVAYAKIFLEEQGSLSLIDFVDGREIGSSAPEHIHQINPFPHDIRAVEHTWLLVLSSFKYNCLETFFSLVKIVYRFQNQEWQFFAQILDEQCDPSLFISGE